MRGTIGIGIGLALLALPAGHAAPQAPSGPDQAAGAGQLESGQAGAGQLDSGQAGAGQLDSGQAEPRAFALWLADFRREAAAAGIGEATLASVVDRLSYIPQVVALDRSQPDDSRASGPPPSLRSYLDRRLGGRLDPGRARAERLAGTLAEVERRYGVPREILLAVWGMETSYGGYTGRFDVPSALASLAYDGRRRELFTGELLAALRIIDRGLASRAELIGSWAGAMGQPQFLPSSYLEHAVDGDGDGRADIWSSEPDTLASIANYLAKSGWRRGGGWGMAVIVPAALDRQRVRELVVAPSCPRVFARHSRWLTVREWRHLGLVAAGGRWPGDDTYATLIEPDGPGRGGYLTYGNYRAILAYNCSNYYALSIGLLADQLAEPPRARLGSGVRGEAG